MVFYCHLTVSLLHLFIGRTWINLKDSVVTVVAWSENGDNGIRVTLGKSDRSGNGLENIYLALNQTVTCTQGYKVMVELHSLRVVHI